jgi:hypothetical protein
MATFNIIFEGVTPSPAREVVSEAIQRAKPEILIMPAAGRFAAIQAVVKSGFPADRVHASDISLFSSIVGFLADPSKSLEELGIIFIGPGELFAEGLSNDPFEIASAAMIAVKYEHLRPKHQYGMNLRRELFFNRLAYRETLRKELVELVTGIGPIHYEIADLREAILPHRDDPGAACYLNPPSNSPEATVRLLAFQNLRWNRQTPSEPWDKAAQAQLYRDLTDAPMLAIVYSVNAAMVPDSWTRILAVDRKYERTDYLVANRPLPIAHTKVELTQTNQGTARIFDVYADQEITPDSVLEFVEIDRPTVMYYRDLFVHRLGTTQSEWYIAMLVDGRLVTVIGLNRQRFMHFKSGYVKETFGISATSQRYKRIGRLFMLALTTTAFRDWMRKHGRYGIREMLGVETTSLTKYAVSKNDRALMQLVSREQLPNGTFKLQYRADLRDETFHDVLVHWLATESQHTRSGESATSSVPAREGRRTRRERSRQARAAEATSDG